MHPQLAAVIAELESAQARLDRLAIAMPAERWATRADPNRWSAGECVAHLNLTSRAYLPLLDAALEEGRRLRDAGVPAERRYRRDLVGWLLWRTMGPPVRLKTQTAAAFIPSGSLPKDVVLNEFASLQAALVERVRAADGLPLGRLRVRSPFDARVTYNAYAALTILPRHQHRHLWQAERA